MIVDFVIEKDIVIYANASREAAGYNSDGRSPS